MEAIWMKTSGKMWHTLQLLAFFVVRSGAIDYVSTPPSLSEVSVTLHAANFTCPVDCVCDQDNVTQRAVVCSSSVGYHGHFATFFAEISKDVENVTVVEARFPLIPSYLNTFHHLRNLTLVDCHIASLNETAFKYLYNLTYLDLRQNEIRVLAPELFKDLTALTSLDLSDNVIERLPENLFASLYSLKSLNLRNNRIQYLAARTFQNLARLIYLDLSFNQLEFLESDSLGSLTSLMDLKLNSNSLRSLPPNCFLNMTKLVSIQIHNNSWVCSCSMHWLAFELNSPLVGEVFKNRHQIKCQSPVQLQFLKVQEMEKGDLMCEEPDILFATESSEVSYQNGMVLRCNVSGYPKPSIYWVTPQGHIVAHESQREWIDKDTESVVTYAGMPTYIETRATPLEDGSLMINNLRNYLAGNYTCIAVNPVGNISEHITINITSNMPHIYIVSLMVSFSSMGVTSLIGIIGGLIRCLIDKIKASTQKEQAKVEETEEISSYESISPAHSPKRWPPHPNGGSPRKSYVGSDDEYESDDGGKDTFAKDLKDMKETLDEMQIRLRTGVQKTTEKVRTRVRSQANQIRESTSHYMHTLRDSSALTAHRVRAGMALSVEQMKSGVQSFREFCGTGDLCHTISTVSVSTDVDSQEKSTVVKSITYV